MFADEDPDEMGRFRTQEAPYHMVGYDPFFFFFFFFFVFFLFFFLFFFFFFFFFIALETRVE